MKRGDIYTANLRPRSGAEIRSDKPRPVLVMSHDGFNQISTWQSVIVIPISTSSAQAKRGPTAVFLPKGSGGLNYDSIAVCHQITTLDRSKLTHKIGTLSVKVLQQVEIGIKNALDINNS
ncbi:type II toxin-antitoxin system PemK/MazF family toxin [Candidatus Marithrix sp. Canyon 246]|uniref:type II toxin-antitoxin system PemK/MazF family toxin n=1 Tax=Candidatus Marithrix sp. Canyon 246 TaxID=1827136 RepID=UPI000849FD3D|nr:type II toxin-antitoxin system PemK/MazF family toxin [Candidatus Marithrix sp. Canyon 246]